MKVSNFQLVCMILYELLFVILPFMFAFRKECRFCMRKTVGIFTAYLMFACMVSFICVRLFWGQYYLRIIWSCTSMATNIVLCKWLVKTDWQVIVYSLFLFKNFTDVADFLAELFNAALHLKDNATQISSTELLYQFVFLCFIVMAGYNILHKYLVSAVEYTRPLPVWKYLAFIPVLFFIMFRLSSDSLAPMRILTYHPDMLMFAVFWFACIYTVHYVSLRILSRLAETFAIKEQYRTVRLLTSVQTSQMATLQQNLENYSKARHDYRHHLITLKGLLEQKDFDSALTYINEYLGTFQKLDTAHYCANPAANALLNYYIQSAQSDGIEVEPAVTLPPFLSLPDIDFCTILGNLLANALESCQRQKEGPRRITINIGQAGGTMIALSIQNTYSHEIRMKGDRFMSSKRDDLGTGTSSVAYLVERYHGIIKFNYDNGIFEVSLLLNPQMKE